MKNNIVQKIKEAICIACDAYKCSFYGATLFERARIFSWFIVLSFRRMLRKRTSQTLDFTIAIDNRQILFHVESLFDLRLLKDIFFDEEYAIDLPRAPEVVFDIGANIGVSALYFAVRYPKAHIYAFEPGRAARQQLEKNVAAFPMITVLPYAITDSDGTVTLYDVYGRTESSSLIKRKKAAQEYDVQGRALTSITRDLGVERIDLMKFDIEGGEIGLFKGAELSKVAALVGEIHSDLAPSVEAYLTSRLAGWDISKEKISPVRFILRAQKPAVTE